jgi:microcystin-dependent protein
MGIINNTIAIEAGTVVASPAGSMRGFLLCNGTTVSRTTYNRLFAAIGTKYGAGDGSTTFKIPDFRGDFIRGYLSGTSAAIGTRQAEGLPNITGTTGFVLGSAGLNTGAFDQSTAGTFAGGTLACYQTTFNASRSNGLYGDSSHVTPRNNALNFFIKY